MTEQQVVEYIKQHLDALADKYGTKGERLLYEQGILLGLLATLSLRDSHNFEVIRRKLKSLDK